MDPFLLVLGVGSMLLAGYLANERGRSQSRWVWTAAAIGPLAIPLLYLADGAAALRRRMSAARPN
jgi:hypothetical protein